MKHGLLMLVVKLARTRIAGWQMAVNSKEAIVGTTTFQKRQKEMKRQEKQRMKADKRAQRKLAKNTEGELGAHSIDGMETPDQETGADPMLEPRQDN